MARSSVRRLPSAVEPTVNRVLLAFWRARARLTVVVGLPLVIRGLTAVNAILLRPTPVMVARRRVMKGTRHHQPVSGTTADTVRGVVNLLTLLV